MKYIYLLSALFGLLLPMAVRAQNVSNTGAYPHYASPYVFHENTATDIGYAYNSNDSMTRNLDRHIGLMEYDSFNNPRLIQFTDGSATEYVYDASGTKLKTVHRTAVPGIEVPYGTVYEHTASTVLSSDSTLYAGPFVLSGDSLRYQYDGGSILIPLDGSPVKPCFYALDHLVSVRLVVSADGQVIERNDYYPSGCLITENIDGETVILPYKYNGKELDPMHGLYTYDYGARLYDPATMLWDRMDPLCEDNPEVSPYVYCGDNPVKYIDSEGKEKIMFFIPGSTIGNSTSTDNSILIQNAINYPDDETALHIFTHGYTQSVLLWLCTDGPHFITSVQEASEYSYKYKPLIITESSKEEVENLLLSSSMMWEEHKENNTPLTIVLHSCHTGQEDYSREADEKCFGRMLSEMFPDVTVIAPSNSITVEMESSELPCPTIEKVEKGKWMQFNNGKLTNSYPGNEYPCAIDGFTPDVKYK